MKTLENLEVHSMEKDLAELSDGDLHRKAVSLARKLRKATKNKLDAYSKLAEEEDVEMDLVDETLGDVEFRVTLIENQFLSLLEARHILATRSERKLYLTEALGRVLDDWLAARAK